MRKLAVSFAAVLLAVQGYAAAPAVPELLGMLPADASTVVGVDFAALRAHPRAQAWLLEHQAPWSGVDDEVGNFLADAGFDPTLDVDYMLVAVTGQERGATALAVFAGRYDPASLAAALAKRGGERVALGDTAAFRFRDGGGATGEAVLVLPSEDLVLVGSEAMIVSATSATPAANALVREAVAAGQLDLHAPFWMVVRVPERVRAEMGKVEAHATEPEAQAMEGVMRASAAVSRAAMYAQLDERLELRAFAVATTPENAELLRDAIKGALAAMRLQAQEREPRLVEVLRQVVVQVDGASVSVSGGIPVQLLEEMASKVKGEAPGAAETK
jgi:hypothetical protein